MVSHIKDMQEDLMQFGKAWDRAIVANDANEIGRFMSDDWVIVGTEGGITSKSNFLEFIQSGYLPRNEMDFEDIPFSYYEWSTNMYINDDGTWRCVLTMLTPAERTQ
jgi:hypothetical protein